MNKIIACLFIIVMLIPLCGCIGGDDSDNNSETTPAPTTTAAPTTTQPPSTTPAPTTIPPTTTPAPDNIATVYEVIDGDTIKVEYTDGHKETVRMLGIDTPELTINTNDVELWEGISSVTVLKNWGIKAKEFTEEKLLGKQIKLEYDETADLEDAYGRTLAYVIYSNQWNFSRILIDYGYARACVEYQCSMLQEFVEAETMAQESKEGLWSEMVEEGTNDGEGNIIISYVHYDAAGNDNQNKNDEYVIIKNIGNASINIQGWKIKDEGNKHVYTFFNVTIAPNETVTLYTGCGTDTNTKKYWCEGTAVWNNDGDIATLYDNQGNIIDTYDW